jgi:hypothetical protein
MKIGHSVLRYDPAKVLAGSSTFASLPPSSCPWRDYGGQAGGQIKWPYVKASFHKKSYQIACPTVYGRWEKLTRELLTLFGMVKMPASVAPNA